MNIELLKDAYQIIDGIPDKKFSLDGWFTRKSKCICNTIACAGGWLALHPDMEISFSEEEKSIYYRGSYGFWALAKFFCITHTDAIALFGPSNYRSKYNPSNKDITDKQLWLARVKKFLKEHEEA